MNKSANNNIGKGSIVKISNPANNDEIGYYKVTSLRGGKANLGSIFGKGIYHKGIAAERLNFMSAKYCTDKTEHALDKLCNLLNAQDTEGAVRYLKCFSNVRQNTLVRNITARRISFGVFLQSQIK